MYRLSDTIRLVRLARQVPSGLDLVSGGLRSVREFESGEALASYQRQIANLKALSDDGLFSIIDRPEDISAARSAGNIGDIMTEEPRHGGLTEAGADVVREMNRTGMIVDLAHASEATALGALEVSSRPVMASHTHVHSNALSLSRFISQELAKAVASAGGILGAWPAGIDISDLTGFVERTLELVETVGVDHVCLGTDMDANYKPVLETLCVFLKSRRPSPHRPIQISDTQRFKHKGTVDELHI